MKQRHDQMAGYSVEEPNLWVSKRHRREIERAIANVKRTELDKWFRKQFYREKAKDRWSDERWRRYREWRRSQGDPDFADSERTQRSTGRRLVVPSWMSVVTCNGVVYGVDHEERAFFEIGNPGQKIGFDSKTGQRMVWELEFGEAEDA